MDFWTPPRFLQFGHLQYEHDVACIFKTVQAPCHQYRQAITEMQIPILLVVWNNTRFLDVTQPRRQRRREA